MLVRLGREVAGRAMAHTVRDPAAGFHVRRYAGPVDHVGRVAARVVHLTDLHVGTMTPVAIHHAAARLVRALLPDLVVITGDFVCHSQHHLDALTSVIAALPPPVVCVLGNHDHWAGAAEVRRALVRGGALVLQNEHTTLSVGGERLQLVGLDDAYTGHADVARAVRGLDSRVPALGLSHIAEEAEGLWAARIPLVLSGHTHAGQITVGRVHELALGHFAGHRYVHGLYGSRAPGAGAVYVNAGVGASVITVRVGARARREIAVFELGAPPGSFFEPLTEQTALAGRPPTPRVAYRRAAAVARRELRRR